MNEDIHSMLKIAELRDRVRSGSYAVPPELVAEALLRRLTSAQPQPESSQGGA